MTKVARDEWDGSGGGLRSLVTMQIGLLRSRVHFPQIPLLPQSARMKRKAIRKAELFCMVGLAIWSNINRSKMQ